jgi:translation initiation factor 2B subunit (eIF-2B alpha/beta/delta family)
MVAKKNHLFYLMNVLFHHTLQARPNSVTLPFWLSEVAEAVSGFVSKPEVDQPMLQIAILKVVHATLERQQMALHAQCKNAVHFLVNGMRNREHKSEEEGPPPNVIVLHSCSAALLRVAADLLRTTVSSGGLFDDQALDNVQLVIPEGRPTMSGMEVVRKLFEEVKREKERLGNSFQMPSLQSPGASDYGLDAVHLHFLENTAQNRVSIVSTTDAGLSSWLLHAALHGQPPVVVIGASAVTENGMTVAESGAFALACAARQVSVGVFVMVRTEVCAWLTRTVALMLRRASVRPLKGTC